MTSHAKFILPALIKIAEFQSEGLVPHKLTIQDLSGNVETALCLNEGHVYPRRFVRSANLFLQLGQTGLDIIEKLAPEEMPTQVMKLKPDPSRTLIRRRPHHIDPYELVMLRPLIDWVHSTDIGQFKFKDLPSPMDYESITHAINHKYVLRSPAHYPHLLWNPSFKLLDAIERLYPTSPLKPILSPTNQTPP